MFRMGEVLAARSAVYQSLNGFILRSGKEYIGALVGFVDEVM